CSAMIIYCAERNVVLNPQNTRLSQPRQQSVDGAAQVQHRQGTPASLGRIRRTVRKYFNIFRVSLIERMAYRGDFLLGTFLRFLPLITTILLWQAIYGRSDRELFGFNFRQMIAY